MREYIDRNKKYTNSIDMYYEIEGTKVMNREKYAKLCDENYDRAIKITKHAYYDANTLTKYMLDILWFEEYIKTYRLNNKEDIENKIEFIEEELKHMNCINEKIRLLNKLNCLKGRLNEFKYDDVDKYESDLYSEWDNYTDNYGYEYSRSSLSPQQQFEVDYNGDTFDYEGGNYDQDLY